MFGLGLGFGSGGAPLALNRGGRPAVSLASILQNPLMQIEATLAASYNGNGIDIKNMIERPFDGLGQSAYDMWLGLDGVDAPSRPAFMGNVGDPAAYFAMNGASVLRIKAMTQWLLNTPKAAGGFPASPYTFIHAFSIADVVGACRTFTTQSGSSSARGVNWSWNTSEQMNFTQGDGSVSNVAIGGAGAQCTINQMTLAIVSINTDGTVRFAVNNRTPTDIPLVWGGNTDDAAGAFTIGGHGSVTSGTFMPAGSKVKSGAIAAQFVTPAQIAQIFDYYNALHNTVYA